MDIEVIKSAIVTNAYHIDAAKKIALSYYKFFVLFKDTSLSKEFYQ